MWKSLYFYEGPVMRFENCIMSKWKASTYASSEAKARSNLIYRFKMENGLIPETKISLPGKISKV